jgi:hypothetical protein
MDPDEKAISEAIEVARRRGWDKLAADLNYFMECLRQEREREEE